MTELRPTAETREYNHQFYAVAEATGVRSDTIKAEMDDRSLGETRIDQQYTTLDGFADISKAAVRRLLASAGGSLGFVVGALAPFIALRNLAYKLLEAHEQGAALANASARDAMHLAVLNLGSGSLPEGFVQQQANLLKTSVHGAERILAHLHATGQHAELEATTDTFITRGVNAARTRGLKDAESLAEARADKAFEADYRNNPAFRLGVDAAIYQANKPGST